MIYALFLSFCGLSIVFLDNSVRLYMANQDERNPTNNLDPLPKSMGLPHYVNPMSLTDDSDASSYSGSEFRLNDAIDLIDYM